MAIDLNKDHYDRDENGENIRTVYPETQSEEIYPQREIYPQGNDTDNSEEVYLRGSAENAREEIPQNEVRHIETVQERALTNPPQNDIINKEKKHKKKKHKKGWIVWLVLIVLAVSAVENIGEISTFIYTNIMDGTFDESVTDFSAAGITALALSDSNSDVTVKNSSDGDFHISVKTPDSKSYDMKLENGTITVNGSDSSDGFMSFAVDSEITLYIPDGYEGNIVMDNKNTTIECSAGKNLDINNTNGSIKLYDIDGSTVKISNDNASVKLTDVTGDTVKAESKNGSIYAEEVTAASLELNAKNASVTAEKCTASEYAYLNSQNGSITAERSSFAVSASLISANGSVKAEDCIFTGDSVISSENGRVHFDDFSFENMTIKAKNGSIDCEAYGDLNDYKITASAKNGNIDVPENDSGEYTLDLSADNGRVEFGFDGSKPVCQ